MQIKIQLRSFESSKHINEKADGPYRGFGYLSIFSDSNLEPKTITVIIVNFATFDRVVDTKTSIMQRGPNVLNVG